MSKHKDLDLVSIPIPGDLTERFIEQIMALSASVKTDYLKKMMLSQYVGPDTAPALLRRERAIEKWLAVEELNEGTNERIINTHRDFNILPRVAFGPFVDFCADLIVRIIGETPPDRALIGSFSGGASTSRPRTASHPAAKYVGKAHVTPRAKDIFTDIVSPLMPAWTLEEFYVCGEVRDLSFEVVDGNVLFTVPKKSEIDRVACKEPDINMFIQKGIGDFFRRSLLRHRINLNDQTINRSLAHKGSLDGSLATLDLSSASDSVCREFVFLLLPVTWYTLLDSVRSPVTIIDGEEHRNEMFSSMGNGFTFELESLLFYVLARAVARFTKTSGVISIYGDDIICPTGMAQDLTIVLNYFGFRVNHEKSFYDGPFRESCGGHYYNGHDVTPFYIKEPISSITDLIHVANSFREWSRWIPHSYSPEGWLRMGILDPEAEPIWLWLKTFIPSYLWGGVDTSFKYQLVSQDTPEFRISEETRRLGTGFGGYLHWLNATWDRDQLREPVRTSRRTVGTNKFRLKRARTSAVDRLLSHFISEMG